MKVNYEKAVKVINERKINVDEQKDDKTFKRSTGYRQLKMKFMKSPLLEPTNEKERIKQIV